jgi:hypothetical protein
MSLNVADEQFRCPVCNTKHSWRAGVLVAPSLDQSDTEVVGWKMCETHDKQEQDDKVFIVGVDVARTKTIMGEVGPDDIVRSGSYAAMDEAMFREVFEGVPVPPGRVVYAAQNVLMALGDIMGQAGGATQRGNNTKH